VLSVIVAGVCVLDEARHVLASPLSVRTTIVGYPIFADFNGSRYLTVWYLATIAWPLLALLLFVALRWTAGRVGSLKWRDSTSDTARVDAPAGDADTPAVGATTVPGRVAAAGRVLTVALVWGFAGAIVRDDQGFRFWRDLLAFAAIYVVVLLLVTGVLLRLRRRLPAVLRWNSCIRVLNAAGAVLTLLGMVAVSERTVLVTASDHVSHPMHWLPLPLGVAASVVLLGVVGAGVWRARGSGLERLRTIERRALFLVCVPVAIFLATAVVPGGMGPFDVFEVGQLVTTLQLFHLGEFPWRDFMMYHGLFSDTFLPAVGYKLLNPSVWGALAGISLIVAPLTWITMYLFAYRVVGVSWAATIAVILVFFNTTLTNGGAERLLLWPLLLILLAVTLDRRSRWAAACLGGALVGFAVLVPEATYALPACGAAILAHDAYHARWARIRLTQDFALSLWTVAGGVALAAAFLAILVANHAVGGFIDYYVTLVPGHDLEGALPLALTLQYASPGMFIYWMIAPGAGVLFAAVYLGLRLRLRRSLRTNHFLLIATGIFVVLYYQEFTGRADLGHLALVYEGALPLLLLCGWEIASQLNGLLRRSLVRLKNLLCSKPPATDSGALRWPLWYAIAAAVALTTSTSLPALVAAAPADFRSSAQAEPWLSSLGFLDYGAEAHYNDLSLFVSTFLPAGAEIYDFSNEPGVYYYILDYRPATPHFVVAEDIVPGSQEETIAELRAHPPALVAFAGSDYGSLTSWDGIVNAVRSYDIAEYLLDEYQPLADVGGDIFYANKNLHLQIPRSLASELGSAMTVTDIPFQYPTCSWGDVPEFLGVEPPTSAAVTAIGGSGVASEQWTLTEPPGEAWSAYHWIELTIAPGSPAATFTLSDREVRGEQHDIVFQSLAGGQTSYQFPIGACPQWHGYSLPALDLTTSSPVTITQVRLRP
jgi:hypothetical protein